MAELTSEQYSAWESELKTQGMDFLFNQTNTRKPTDNERFIDPWLQKEIEELRAVWKGEGSAVEQHEVLNNIICKLCLKDESSYIAKNPEASAFLAGRQFVGQTLIKLINLSTGSYPTKK